jgi:methionine synthase I (cobalamin-dependent)
LLAGIEALYARAAHGVVLADGGTGTVLMARGLPRGTCAEAWNLSHPEQVVAVAASYAAAGSDLIYTNTFGANRPALRRYGLADQVGEINAAAVRLARQGAGPGKWVAGSVGPTGALLEPFGELAVDTAATAFQEQAAALVAAGVDVLVLETFSQLEEAQAALRAVRRVTSGPVVVSLSFDAGGRTVMGASPAQAAGVLLPAGADALGVNCGGEWADVADAAAALAVAAPGTPLLLKPNAGRPVATANGVVYPGTPEAFADFVGHLAAQLPVRIAGGCCGTGPDHISALRRTLAALRRAGAEG